MTNQEAINRIEQHMRIHFVSEYPHAVYITEALNMAIEALKAREPMEPQKQIEQREWTVCGNCKNHLIYKWKYCGYCGHEVKWNEHTSP